MVDGKPLLLDGHNNAGFSGGPVVRRLNGNEQSVIAVVSGYRYDRGRMRDENGNETSYTYDTNTGIIVAHNIRHAVELVASNPIGITSRTPINGASQALVFNPHRGQAGQLESPLIF